MSHYARQTTRQYLTADLPPLRSTNAASFFTLLKPAFITTSGPLECLNRQLFRSILECSRISGLTIFQEPLIWRLITGEEYLWCPTLKRSPLIRFSFKYVFREAEEEILFHWFKEKLSLAEGLTNYTNVKINIIDLFIQIISAASIILILLLFNTPLWSIIFIVE